VTLRTLFEKLGDSIVRYSKGTNILDDLTTILPLLSRPRRTPMLYCSGLRDAPTMTGEAPLAPGWLPAPAGIAGKVVARESHVLIFSAAGRT